MSAQVSHEDAGVVSRPPALGALTKAPGTWFGFACAVAGGFYVARLVSVTVHEVLGHGLATEIAGGQFRFLAIHAGRGAMALCAEVPPDAAWVPQWAGIASEAMLGLAALLFFRRRPRPLAFRSLALFWLAAVPLGRALLHAIEGAVLGKGDAAPIATGLGLFPRIGILVCLVAGLALLLRSVVARALRWVEEEFEPRDARQRSVAFGIAVVAPLAAPLVVLFAYLPRTGSVPRWATLSIWGTAVGALYAYGIFRARRAPADFDPWIARPVRVVKGLAWLTAAAAAFLATVALPQHLSMGSAGSWQWSVPTATPLRTFEPRFPRVDLVPQLLDAPVVLPEMSGLDPTLTFTTWFDGQPVLVRTTEGECVAIAEGMAPVGSLRTDGDIVRAVLLHPTDGEPLAVALTQGEKDAEYEGDLRALGADGRERWTLHVPESFPKSLAVLHGDRGPSGLLVGAGGETGLVAATLDGDRAWDVPEELVICHVRTHGALPDRALQIGGDFNLYEGTSTTNGPRVALAGRGGWYFTEGLLFPDGEGRPALALAGTLHSGDEPILVRVDANGEDCWRATLPSEPEGLELLEPPGRRRLLVVTTAGGDLLVLDEEGTLLARETLPDAAPRTRTATYALAAGRLGSETWAVAVALLHGTLVYRVHPERIPAR